MASFAERIGSYSSDYPTFAISISGGCWLSDNSYSKLNWSIKWGSSDKIGSVKIESNKTALKPVEFYLKEELDSSDNQVSIIFNQTQLRALELMIELSRPFSETFQWKSFVSCEKILPLSESSINLEIEAHSRSSHCTAGFTGPDFEQLEIRLKPRDFSKIEEKIEFQKESEGVLTTCIDRIIFNCFKLSITSPTVGKDNPSLLVFALKNIKTG